MKYSQIQTKERFMINMVNKALKKVDPLEALSSSRISGQDPTSHSQELKTSSKNSLVEETHSPASSTMTMMTAKTD